MRIDSLKTVKLLAHDVSIHQDQTTMLPATSFPVKALMRLPLEAFLTLLNTRSLSYLRHPPDTLTYDKGPVYRNNIVNAVPENYLIA